MFPFADGEQTDPKTGHTDGLLSRLADLGMLPKIFYTNSSKEYWRGDSALIHTDVEGTRDLPSLESTRIYHYAGTQHPSGTFPPTDDNLAFGLRGYHQLNWVDYRPLLRAALVRLDEWVTSGITPPPSRHPRVDDGTAISSEQSASAFQSIPNVEFPDHHPHLFRLDFGAEHGIISQQPPIVGEPYPMLVSAVDQDGNELGGIRLPDLTVPLATHTGWNLRHPDTGGADQILGILGSTIPLPVNHTQRQASGDPRLSLEERYSSLEDYLLQVRQAAHTLIEEGYLLADELELLVEHATERYNFLFQNVVSAQPAD